jgi:hypothetical protein
LVWSVWVDLTQSVHGRFFSFKIDSRVRRFWGLLGLDADLVPGWTDRFGFYYLDLFMNFFLKFLLQRQKRNFRNKRNAESGGGEKNSTYRLLSPPRPKTNICKYWSTTSFFFFSLNKKNNHILALSCVKAFKTFSLKGYNKS